MSSDYLEDEIVRFVGAATSHVTDDDGRTSIPSRPAHGGDRALKWTEAI